MILSADTENKIEQILVQQGLITPEKLTAAKSDAQSQNIGLIQYLVEKGQLKDEDATKVLAMGSNIPYVDLSTISIPENVLAIIPREIAQNFSSVAFGIVDGKLNVATVDPQNLQAIDFMSRKTG